MTAHSAVHARIMVASSSESRTQKIIDRFTAHKSTDGYPPGGYRRAAVLICLVPNENDELDIILTVRSTLLRSHAGEVALPGGKVEKDDADIVFTAFREAEEEVGLPKTAHRHITTLRPYISKNLLIVTPVVTLFDSNVHFTPVLNPAEVSSIFMVPLKRFLLSHNYTYVDFDWLGGRWRMHRYSSPHVIGADDGGLPIVGLTAMILYHAAAIGYGFYHEHGGKAKYAGKGTVVDGVMLEVEDYDMELSKEKKKIPDVMSRM